jgi:hypothetical protein
MAVGRITGPLLAKNLLRDGVDLSIETDLLYLDVTSGRIGIKTDTPGYTLDVNGDTNILALRVVTTSTLGNLTISSTTASTILSNSVGNTVIAAPTESKILLQNDTVVSGNLHATGNITAQGSVQIGNITGSDTLSLYADITSNITPQTPGQYNIGAPGKEWAQGYIDSLVATALIGKENQDLNISADSNGVLNLRGRVRIWDENPLGTGPVTQNVLYVNMDGSDTNDGRSNDPSRACRTISGAIRSPFYKANTSIKVAPGRYLEDNPIRLKPYTSVIGSDLRTTVIEPINKTQDLFWLDSGNYLAQMLFVNGQSGLLPGVGYTPGTNRGAYATAFAPNFGGDKIDLYHSPYVQNCSNQSGPWLYDGTMFNPNQTVQVPEAVGTATWVINTTTLLVHVTEGELEVGQTINIGPTPQGYVNARTLLLANREFFQEQVISYIDSKYEYFGYDEDKCARDTGLIIDSLVSDLVFGGNGYTQSNFAGLQYWNQNGYTGSIAGELTTTTAAINFVSTLAQEIVQNITTGTRFLSTGTQTTGTAATITEAAAIATDFSVITTILTSGTDGVTDIVQPNTINVVSTNAQRAADLLQANKTYIQEQAVAFVEATKTPGFAYDPVKCYRDVGYMVDSVTFDILYGGNRQAVTSGVYYYGFSETSSAIPNERPQTTAAFYRIREILEDIITNQLISKSIGNISTQNITLPESISTLATPLQEMIDLITQIINAGPDAALEPQPISLTKSADANVIKAANILLANKAFITTEVINFIEQRYNNGFVYNQPKCFRDTGLIVDSIAIDLLYNGDTQSTFAGLQYWNQDGYTGTIETEATATTLAINFVSALAQQVIQNNTTGTRYQSTLTQTTGTAATIAEATVLAEEFGIITNIITNGTAGVTDIIVPNGTASTATNVINAANLLQANKTYIQAETVSYINSTYQIFDTAKCERDTGLIIDSLAIDLMFQGTSQSKFAGLQYWNQGSYVDGIVDEITTTTNAIEWAKEIAQRVVVNDTNGTRYSTGTQITGLPTATSAEATVIGNEFDIILDILTTGTVGVSDLIVPNGISPSPTIAIQNAYAILQANKVYIQQEVIAYVEAIKTPGFTYDQTDCIRDVGYIVDSISFDLLYGGNRQAVMSGVYYYGFSGQSAITGEIQNTIAAYTRIKELLPYVVQGISTSTVLQTNFVQVTSITPAGTVADTTATQALVDLITTIIEDGPSVVSGVEPVGLTATSTTSTANAAALLLANRSFIVAEVLEYISNPTDFIYDQTTCARDVGYIIDSVTFDLVHGGNRQAVTSGVYYYDFNETASAIPNEIPQTTAAYNHIRNLVDDILTNTPITPTTGNTSTQVFLTSTATNLEVLAVFDKIDTITDIINNGPTAVSSQEPIGLVASTSTNVITAYNLLMANKSFIQNEVIAYVNVFDTGFVYNRAKCRRDVGIIVENVAYDVAFGGNEKSRESGLAYWQGVTSYIANEITETADAFEYLEDLMQDVISNNTATNLMNDFQTAPQVINTALTDGSIASGVVTKLIDLINDIIVNGPDVAPQVQYGNGPDWGSVSAEVLLEANRSFIQNEIIAWTNINFPNLIYREDKCYRDTGLIIDAIGQDIILNANAKSIEAGVSYWYGGQNSIANAESGQKDQVVETVAAINRAKEIALQIINNTTVTTTAFVFNPTKCARDTGLIVDCLAQDLLFGGNSQSNFAGIQYWNHDNYVGDIAAQLNTTTAAINYISSVAQEIVQNITTGVRYQSTVTQNTTLPSATISESEIIAKNFSTVTNILTNGVIGVTDAIIPNNLTRSGNANVQNAFELLQANKDYLKAEAIAFIESTKSFGYDEIKCARDSGLIVDSIAFDLAYPTSALSQSTFAGLQYWNQNGYTGSIAEEITTTTNAINYVNSLAQLIIQNSTGGLRYQSNVTQVVNTQSATVTEAGIIDAGFDLILNIITNGTDGVTDIIVPNGLAMSTSTDVINAYTLLQANKEYIQAEAVAFVEATKTPGFTYDQELCYRDVGYMLDSVAFDLVHGGNRQAVQSGVYYYTFNGSDSAIPNEIPQTVAAFEFIKTLTTNLVQNIVITPLQTAVTQDTSLPSADPSIINAVEEPTYKIINIIENGPGVAVTKQPISLTETNEANRLAAARILLANRAFIQAETIAYINQFLTFQYDQATCARDVGYILDSVSFDLLYGGNRQSIQSGVYYWGYSNRSTSLPSEKNASTLAYQYMKDLMTNVVLSRPPATSYQNTVTQIVSASTATKIEVAVIGDNIDLITTIINEGPQSAGPKEPIGLIENNNQFTRNAVNLLSANRDYIVAEVIAFVDQTQVSNEQVFLPFYDMGANATLAVIRNFDIITNILQNGPGVAPTQTDGNGIFVKTGLNPDDINVGPVITAITTVSSNVYRIDISESTVGYGDAQPLYFGQTRVFPLLDEDVPDRWAQRRINPIGSMGGTLVDGGVISDRSPINSYVFDAFTQINQGGEGIRITNNGYAQLVSVFTIFCSRAVVVENGGIASITNSNSNFGDTCLTAKGYGRRDFSGYIKNPPVLPFFPNGVYPSQAQVEVYIADPDLRPHISLVMEVEPPVGFINNQGLPGFLSGNTTIDVLTTGTIEITGIDNSGMVVGQDFFVIDQFGRSTDSNNQPYVRPGTIVADVNFESVTLNFPLNSGGGEPGNSNYFKLFSCGNAYYTVLSSVLGNDPFPEGTLLLPNQQNVQEALSLDYINTLSQLIVSNQPVTPLQTATTQVFSTSLAGGSGANAFIGSRLNTIGSILRNGPASAPEITYTGTLPSGAGSAASLLRQNREFIQDEIIAYVDNEFFDFDYDQVKCARDTGLIVDSIAQDLLFNGTSQTTFAGLQYWNQNTTTNSILFGEITTTTNAINYVKTISQQIVQGINIGGYTSGTQITNIPLATSAEAGVIGADFDVILNILNTGTAGITDIVVPNGITPSQNINIVRAYNLLQANKTFIQEEAIAFVEATKTPGFVYTTSTCYRDVGYIIDSISVDLLYGGNRQAVQSGVYYYGYESTSSAIAGEITQSVDAYNFLDSLSQKIVLGQSIITQQTVVPRVTAGFATATTAEAAKIQNLVANMTNIVANGPTATISNVPLPLSESIDVTAINAAKMVDANRGFIVAEAVAFVNETFPAPGFTYDQVKCARDTGLIVDAIAQDLLFESTSQSIFAGVQYWNHDSYVGTISNEITTTTNAVNFIKSLAQKVVVNDTSGLRYQSIVSQNTTLTAATGAQATTIGTDFDVITNILTNGVAGVTDIIVPNSITKISTAAVQNAFNLLVANKAYIQAEAVAYVESTKTPGFAYDQAKCYRDVGYMIDAVAIDLLYGGNRQSVQAGVYYYSFNATSTALPGEQAQSVAAYNYIRSLLSNVISGTPVSSPKQLIEPQVTSGTTSTAVQVGYAQAKIDIITNIITNGPRVIKTPINVNSSTDQEVINAAKILDANREFIVAETVAYINNKYQTYNRVKCRRDVGFIVDALIYDLEKGGNYNAVIAGKSYYATPGTRHIVQLEENLTDPSLFPDGAICTFYQRSYMSASGYLFEYVGAGTNYGSLPQRGIKDPVQTKEVVQLNNGKVFFTSTDQNGDFRIGTGLVISQATGVLSGRTFTKSLFANLTPFILAIEG